MLRLASNDEKTIIQDIWHEQSFDLGFDNYYFAAMYSKSMHYVLANENIETVIDVMKHAMMLNGRKLSVSLISGIKTASKYRFKDNEKILLEEVLSQLSRQDLVSLVHAKDKELYLAAGFELIYLRNCYHIERYLFDGVETHGVTHEFESIDLLKAYNRFVERFNAYILRDKEYYDDYLIQLEFRNMHLMAVYLDGEIKGYFSFKIIGDELYINECIYSDIKTLAKIISYSLKLAKDVYLYVSEAEHLEKVFKNIKFKTSEYMLARINDYDLFNQLYGCDVTDVKSAMNLFNYPLYIREDL